MDEHTIRNYIRSENLFAVGLLVGTAAGEVLRLLPPYVITAAEIEIALDLLGAGLTELQESRS